MFSLKFKKEDTKYETLTVRFGFALDASDSEAGTGQGAAQILPFPLIIHVVEVAIL